jgi:hypothetical protein
VFNVACFVRKTDNRIPYTCSKVHKYDINDTTQTTRTSYVRASVLFNCGRCAYYHVHCTMINTQMFIYRKRVTVYTFILGRSAGSAIGVFYEYTYIACIRCTPYVIKRKLYIPLVNDAVHSVIYVSKKFGI